MGLNGTGSGFIDAMDFEQGRLVTVVGVPTGNYATGGEPLNDLLVASVMKGLVKIVSGIAPINVLSVQDSLGHWWVYDRDNNKLLNFKTVGDTPTEQSAGAYSGYGNMTSAKLVITILIDKASSIKKVVV